MLHQEPGRPIERIGCITRNDIRIQSLDELGEEWDGCSAHHDCGLKTSARIADAEYKGSGRSKIGFRVERQPNQAGPHGRDLTDERCIIALAQPGSPARARKERPHHLNAEPVCGARHGAKEGGQNRAVEMAIGGRCCWPAPLEVVEQSREELLQVAKRDGDIGKAQAVVAPALPEMLRGGLDHLEEEGLDGYTALAQLRDERRRCLRVTLLAELCELKRVDEQLGAVARPAPTASGPSAPTASSPLRS